MLIKASIGDAPVLDPTLIDWLNPWLLVEEDEVDFRAVMLVLFLLVMLMSPLIEAIDPLILVLPRSRLSCACWLARREPLVMRILFLAKRLLPISSILLLLELVF